MLGYVYVLLFFFPSSLRVLSKFRFRFVTSFVATPALISTCATLFTFSMPMHLQSIMTLHGFTFHSTLFI